MPVSRTPLASAKALCAAGTLLAAGFAPEVTAQPVSFDAICQAAPNATLLTSRVPDQEAVAIQRYDAPFSGSQATLQTIAVADQRLNAVALYEGYLYAMSLSTDQKLFRVGADGTLLDSTVVQNLPQVNYPAGTVDPETGRYFVRRSADTDLYVIDLDDVAAGATTIPVTQGGAPSGPRFSDMAFYDGYLYGYDAGNDEGARIDASTGVVESFPVTGVPATETYGTAWTGQGGTLVLVGNSTNTAYEVDVTGPTWSVIRTVSLQGRGSATPLDGTACPVVPAPPPPTFEPFCAASPDGAVVLNYESGGGSGLYDYVSPAPSAPIGTLPARLNAAAIYDGLLYGVGVGEDPQVRDRLFQVDAAGAILNSLAVPGLDGKRNFYSGAADPSTGLFYTYFEDAPSFYVVDLNDAAAGASQVRLSLNGGPFRLNAPDAAFFDGHLYSYDRKAEAGVKVDVRTGVVELFALPGLEDVKNYRGAWFNPSGRLVINSQDEVYEVDVSGPSSWSVVGTVTVPGLPGRNGDATACPLTQPPPPPSFEAACDASLGGAFVTTQVAGQDAINVFAYTPPSSGNASTLTTTAVASERLNAVALYRGSLFGMSTGASPRLFEVAADGTLLDSTTVPGLPVIDFPAGAVDPATGLYYVARQTETTLYAIDLDDVSAGATAIGITLGGNPYATGLLDFAFYDGYLYGYSTVESAGVKINALTGAAETFAVPGAPSGSVGSAWIQPGGTLALLPNAEETVYELDVSGSAWSVTRTVALSGRTGATTYDAASCPVTPPPPTTFGCDVDPTRTYVTGSEPDQPTRTLYRYSTASGMADLEVFGEIQAPLNAMALHADTLYGFDRERLELAKVLADASIAGTVTVPGLPVDRNRNYVAGAVNRNTSTYYLFARGFQKLYAIDLDNVSAGATKISTVRQSDDAPTLVDFGDFAYGNSSRPRLYGYDAISSQGFWINPTNGRVRTVPLTTGAGDPLSLGSRVNPATWFSSTGTLFLYFSADEVYEFDVSSNAGWPLVATYTGLDALVGQADAASCGEAPATPREGVSGTGGSEATSRTRDVPATVSLGRPYPNPARSGAMVALGLPEAGAAEAAVYDVMGRRVAVIFSGEADAGWTEVPVRTGTLAAGTYIVRLQSASGVATGKLVVID